MKNTFSIFTILLFVLSFNTGSAQVGVGTSSPDASAALDVYSTNSGVLVPRVALTAVTDVTTIVSPASGLLVYNTATSGTAENKVTPGFYYWNGTRWSSITEPVPTRGIASFYHSVSQTALVNPEKNMVYLDNVEINQIPDFVTKSSGGTITLEKGTYRLRGSVGGVEHSGSGNARLAFGFYNVTTDTYFGRGAMYASGNSLHSNSLPSAGAYAVITVTTPIQVRLTIDRALGVNSISNGVAEFSYSNYARSWVEVERIGD